ncbi:MAG: fumarate hydratase, partial [Hyphomicrobiales bacterium]
MVQISQDDFVESIARAFQYISCYHPPDFIRYLSAAHEREESPAARNALAQILVNSRMCALGHRPLCQDTGMAHVFVKLGIGAKINTEKSLQELVDAGVRQAYLSDTNPLRASMVAEPLGARKNSGDNTPAIVHVEVVAGEGLSIDVSAKGGGSENKARFAVLNPSDSISDWVVETVPTLGAGWCPPGILGIGVGGSAEKAMALAKQSLNEPLDMVELAARGPQTRIEELRLEIFERVNALGIGAQGVGGVTTVLDVRINSFPTHAASLPVA